MTISYVSIENMLGLTEAKIEPGHITLIEGHNGAGKSAVVESIIAAFSARGIEGELVTKPAEQGRVFIKFNDGHQLKARFDTDGKKSVTVTTPDGDVKKSPQTWLDNLFGQSIVNPVSFLRMSTQEKRRAILSALPIKVTQDDLIEWFGKAFSVDTDRHGLEVLAEVEKSLYEDRKAANAKVKAIRDELHVLRSSIPPDFDATAWQAIDTGQLTEELQAIGRIESEKRSKAAEAVRVSHDASGYRSQASRYAANIEKLQAEIKQWQERITKAEEDIADNREREAENLAWAEACDAESVRLMAEAEAISVPDRSEVEAKLADFSNAQRVLQQIGNCDRLMAELSAAEVVASGLDEAVELARQKPKALLAASRLPVDGLEFTEDSILVNGLNIDSLSDGEKLRLGVAIARASTGPLGFIVIDGAEALDPANLEQLLAEAKADPYHHYVITRVTSGDLKITTEFADEVDARQTSLFGED